jgi:hypothetical protein
MDFPPDNPLPEMREEGRTRQEALHCKKKLCKFPTRSFSLFPVQCYNDAQNRCNTQGKEFLTGGVFNSVLRENNYERKSERAGGVAFLINHFL